MLSSCFYCGLLLLPVIHSLVYCLHPATAYVFVFHASCYFATLWIISAVWSSCSHAIHIHILDGKFLYVVGLKTVVREDPLGQAYRARIARIAKGKGLFHLFLFIINSNLKTSIQSALFSFQNFRDRIRWCWWLSNTLIGLGWLRTSRNYTSFWYTHRRYNQTRTTAHTVLRTVTADSSLTLYAMRRRGSINWRGLIHPHTFIALLHAAGGMRK